MPSGEGIVEGFKVTKNGGILQSVVREYGLVRIDGKPEKASVYDVELREQVGETPFVVMRRAGPVGFVLKSEGHEDSSLEGVVEAGGILHFNHRLAKIVPPPPPPKADDRSGRGCARKGTGGGAESKREGADRGTGKGTRGGRGDARAEEGGGAPGGDGFSRGCGRGLP